MLFELPATIDIGTKSVTPLAVTPCASPWEPRGWLFSLTFHCSSKPGLAIAATEILSSLRIHEVRKGDGSRRNGRDDHEQTLHSHHFLHCPTSPRQSNTARRRRWRYTRVRSPP